MNIDDILNIGNGILLSLASIALYNEKHALAIGLCLGANACTHVLLLSTRGKI